MPRVLLLAPALAATLCAPVAAATTSWVHFVADGPAYGTFTLPHSIALDFPNATADTRGKYAVLVASDAKGIVALDGVTPDPTYHHYAQVVPKGRITFRLMATGRTTLKVPSRSVRKKTTFHLTKKMNGAGGEVRNLPLVLPNVVTDTIPLTVRLPSVVMHGFYTPGVTTPIQPTNMCVDANESLPCRQRVSTGTGAYWYLATASGEGGEQYAKLTSAVAGVYGTERVHWALVIPTV